MNVEAIVVAAGAGTRMRQKTKKPYLLLRGEPLLIHTLRALRRCGAIGRFVVVTADEDRVFAAEMILRFFSDMPFTVVAGGEERQDSVRCGLAGISRETEIVLVHDAARPFVSAEECMRVIEAARQAGAATLGTPVKDTIKEVAAGKILRTLPRENLMAVQTPQGFRAELLREAHRQAAEKGFRGTDDAGLVEWMGRPVALVPGSYRNMKITTPEDLLIAETFLKEDAT